MSCVVRFQSPFEDSFFSDKVETCLPPWPYGDGFNPLSRIRSSLTHSKLFRLPHTILYRFNPLSRIRSSLTHSIAPENWAKEYAFQSPFEDSFFSDVRQCQQADRSQGAAFQSPFEDSFFSDRSIFVGRWPVDE